MTVIVGMAVSLDGYVADADGDVTPLYPDLVQGSMRENELVRESIESTGAVVMGRGAYDMAGGDFTGYEYQVPISVLTHRPPDERPAGQSEGGLTIEFVTDGLERVMEKAETAAGDQDVTVAAARTSLSSASGPARSTNSTSPWSRCCSAGVSDRSTTSATNRSNSNGRAVETE